MTIEQLRRMPPVMAVLFTLAGCSGGGGCAPVAPGAPGLASPSLGSTAVPDDLSQIQLTGSSSDETVAIRVAGSSTETPLPAANQQFTFSLPPLAPKTTYVVTFSTPAGLGECGSAGAFTRDIGTFTTQ